MIRAGFVLLALVAGYLVFEYGRISAGYDTIDAASGRDAIAFYRGIVSPADGRPGLRVQDFRLTRGAEERQFNLRLVLVQAMKHDRKVSGDVNLSVEGVEDGAARTYAFAELLPAEARRDWPFSFRYFQNFDRQIVLPDGFTPERVHVEVRSRTRSIASIEESFAWATSQG